MTLETDIARLRSRGFIVGKRDKRMNTAFAGRFMVSESYDAGHSQTDGSGGVWCIVGDDLKTLVADALNNFPFFDSEDAA